MNPLVIAAAFGFSGALIIYSLRRQITSRYERDVAWLEHFFWRLNPSARSARPYVLGYYLGALALLGVLIIVLVSDMFAVLCWTLVFFMPPWITAYVWARRQEQIIEQLPGAVRKLSSNVGSGLSLAQGVERLSLRAPMPIRTEFFVISNYFKMGADFESAIEDAKRRLKLQNFTLFASALVVNKNMGGDVTATLDRLAGSLESIASMEREVHSATAEGRMNIKVLAVAPFFMLFLVYFMDPEAVLLLFNTLLGQVILGICFALTAGGTYWAWTIVNSDV